MFLNYDTHFYHGPGPSAGFLVKPANDPYFALYIYYYLTIYVCCCLCNTFCDECACVYVCALSSY